MLWLLVGISVLFFLLLLVGFVWMLLSSGRTTHRGGEKVGSEMFAQQMAEDDEPNLMQKSAFKGEATDLRTESSISFSDIKSLVRDRQWGLALPPLLAITGLLGLLLFGSLALFVAMDDKLVGSVIAVAGIFTVLRVLYTLIRS